MNLINYEFTIKKLIVGQLETNCYIVIDKNKAIIIDPGDCAEAIMDIVKKEKIELAYILNTHGHYDHTGANYIKTLIKNKVLLGIHQKDLVYLKDSFLNLSSVFGSKTIYTPPDFFLKNNQTIELTEKISLKVIHTPGHTPGSVCFKLKNYLFSGDLLFRNGVGRTDLPGGNEHLLIKSLKKICQFQQEMIILPGHGPETTLGYELKTNPYIF
ncbi:MAG: MBL fold metallo-hydrolase [Candidatus Omnitrophica bacterium]|nr:MBL fold metallo-hydrolase [Candidatus Omnitrophota bacterium]MCM8817588.1 MBL fold metallo-hydrolase [Candidatus Omnitrophota bacterium]